jgi:SAM-dependent methyltransferase
MLDAHDINIRSQFAPRIATYETAAQWMLSPKLIAATNLAAGVASAGANQCLDLCCGTGIVGRNLLAGNWQVTGVDVTPEMLAVAEKYFPVRCEAIEKLSFADNSFDLVTLRQSFMLVDGVQSLKQIHRVLKPGGRFILIHSVPFSAMDDEQYEKVQWARHINQKTYYRAEDLEKLFTDSGLEVFSQTFLRVRESVDHWLNSAPELGETLRQKIYTLIDKAPEQYKDVRRVKTHGGQLYEDWNWLIITGTKL